MSIYNTDATYRLCEDNETWKQVTGLWAALSTDTTVDQHFYILWNEDSDKPPRVKFSTLEGAKRSAEEMAHEHGGRFHFCRAEGYAERGDIPIKTEVFEEAKPSKAPKGRKAASKKKKGCECTSGDPRLCRFCSGSKR